MVMEWTVSQTDRRKTSCSNLYSSGGNGHVTTNQMARLAIPGGRTSRPFPTSPPSRMRAALLLASLGFAAHAPRVPRCGTNPIVLPLSLAHASAVTDKPPPPTTSTL